MAEALGRIGAGLAEGRPRFRGRVAGTAEIHTNVNSSESVVWNYLGELKPLAGTDAFERFKADMCAGRLPGDPDDQMLLAGYTLSKLGQQAKALKGWGGTVSDKILQPVRWLLDWFPILRAETDLAASVAASSATSSTPSPRFGSASELTPAGHPALLERIEDIDSDWSETAVQRHRDRSVAGAGDAEPETVEVAVWSQTPEARALIVALPEHLKERVVGQGAAVALVSDMLQLCYVGLREARGPLGVFLFAGPTGVGKTELAKALALRVFGSDLSLFRIDMSAFKAKGDIATLIGSPRGYTDSDQGGTLTGFFTRLRKKGGGAVVLLDEVEKAHDEVVDLFLPAFDEGYLVDGRGARHNCKQVLFIMTSNLGGKELQEQLLRKRRAGDDFLSAEQVESVVLPYVRRHLRPELLGRVDGVACFAPLGEAEVKAIVEMQLGQLRERLLASTLGACGLTWDSTIAQHLLETASSLEHGARGVRKALHRFVAVPLAKLLLELPPDGFPSGSRLLISAADCKLAAIVLPPSRL